MSAFGLSKALADTDLTGDYRLAYLSAGDCGGQVSVKSICEWVNCSEDRAFEIIDAMIEEGYFQRNAREAQPRIYAFQLQEDTTIRVAANRNGRRTPTAQERARVFRRDGCRCKYCGTEVGPFDLDHVVPYSRGGATSVDNLVVACKPCNSSKSNMTIPEWLDRKLGLKA